MKEEYSLGLGNWALILLFQVTSTRLILIPYATTCAHTLARSALTKHHTCQLPMPNRKKRLARCPGEAAKVGCYGTL